uniref:Uncharacterized protein n=1 Tax=Panagrellus redivivus TaxID=6233 RepID=A0A7E4VX64_PANRE
MTEFSNLEQQPTVGKRKITLGYYRYFNTQNEIRCGGSQYVPVDVYKVRAYQLLHLRNGTTIERLIGTSRLGTRIDTKIASHTVLIQGRMLISFDDEFIEIPSALYIGFSKLCACNGMLEMIHGRIRIPMEYTYKNEQLASEKKNVFIKADETGCA